MNAYSNDGAQLQLLQEQIQQLGSELQEQKKKRTNETRHAKRTILELEKKWKGRVEDAEKKWKHRVEDAEALTERAEALTVCMCCEENPRNVSYTCPNKCLVICKDCHNDWVTQQVLTNHLDPNFDLANLKCIHCQQPGDPVIHSFTFVS